MGVFPAHSAWSGVAFEKVCLLHLPQIKQKLGIAGVLTSVYSWRSRNQASGNSLRSNPLFMAIMDCFVATLLAMTREDVLAQLDVTSDNDFFI
jgi:hypothetical protein